jgi:2',3'-cyclic-nucleotide 2'-phosphodiesterase (5'-nucleotidase family)
MKILTALLVALIISTSIYAQQKITILNLNDTHSNLSSGQGRNADLSGKFGGIARAASVIGAAKTVDPNAIVLHAGDSFIGDLFYNKYKGAAEFLLLEQLSLDAITLGNHEWDLGAKSLLEVMDSLKGKIGFNYLSANAIVKSPEVSRLSSYIKPYITKTVGTVKIGIFGLTTPETNILSNCLPDVLIDTSFIETAVATIAALDTTEKCDVVILLSHLGLEYDGLLASYVSGIDLIIGGHDHLAISDVYYLSDADGKNIPYFQTGAFYQNIGKIDLNYKNGVFSIDDFRLIELNETIPEVPAIKSAVDLMISDIEATFGKAYTEKIADCTGDLDEVITTNDTIYNLSTGVGKFVTAAFKDYTKTDIALQPCGSTAQKIFKGPIVGADLYRAVSYGMNTDNYLGFRICTFSIKGSDLLAGLEVGAAQLDYNDEYLIQCAGMNYDIDLSEPQFQRVWVVGVDNGGFDVNSNYTVTTNEMVIAFLDMLQIPYTNLEVKSGVTEYEVVMKYASKIKTISPENYPNNVRNRKMTGVNEKANEYLSNAFPNPSNGISNIEANINQPGNYTLRVIDCTGNIVLSSQCENLCSGHNTIPLNLKNQNDGNYIYSLSNGCKTILGKVMIVK